MALPNYPNNPAYNEQYLVGNKVFRWDGEKWKALSNADETLRSQLAESGSDISIGGANAGDIADARNLFVYPEQFGAVGDGIEDDTASVQAAFDSGKRVILKSGSVYEITGALKYRSNLVVEGEDTTATIRLRTGLNSNMITPDFSSTSITENVVFKNFTIDQQIFLDEDFVESTMIFVIFKSNNVMLDGLRILNPSGDGVYISRTYAGNSTTLPCENVSVTNCDFRGTRINRNGVSVISGRRIRIINNHFIGMTRPNMPAAIDLEPNSPPEDVIFDVVITNNTITASKGGIVTYAVDKSATKITNVVIANNTISSCRGAETASPTSITINSTPGIWISDSQDISVIGNSVLGDALGGAAGIMVDYCKRANVVGNTAKVNEVGVVLARSEKVNISHNNIEVLNDTYKGRTCFGVWAGINNTQVKDSNICDNIVTGVSGATASSAYLIETGLVDSKLHSGKITGFRFGLALGRSLWSNVDLNIDVSSTAEGAALYGKIDSPVSTGGDWVIGEGYTYGTSSFSAGTSGNVTGTAAYIGSVIQVVNTTSGSTNQITANCSTNGTIVFTGSVSSSDTFYWKILKV